VFQLYQEYVESNQEDRYLVMGGNYVNLDYTPQITLDLYAEPFLRFIDQRIMEQLGIYELNRDIQKTSK